MSQALVDIAYQRRSIGSCKMILNKENGRRIRSLDGQFGEIVVWAAVCLNRTEASQNPGRQNWRVDF